MTDIDVVHPEAGERGWSWSDPRDREHFRRCSWCGSVHPDDLAAEPVWRPEWADRKYGWPHKFYVDIPNRDPDALFAIGTTTGDSPGYGRVGTGGLDWVAVADLTPEQREIVDKDRVMSERVTFVGFGTRPAHFGKFYSIHLADPAIAAAVKDTIERRSGIQFTFADGTVAWQPTPTTPTPPAALAP